MSFGQSEDGHDPSPATATIQPAAINHRIACPTDHPRPSHLTLPICCPHCGAPFRPPSPKIRQRCASERDQLDMLCGRFVIRPPHRRQIRSHPPTNLLVRSKDHTGEEDAGAASTRLADLVSYQSGAASRRVFSSTMGMSPGQWRRQGFRDQIIRRPSKTRPARRHS